MSEMVVNRGLPEEIRVDQSLECNEEVNREAIEASQVEATPNQRTWGRNKPVMFREEQEDLRQTWNEGRENGRRWVWREISMTSYYLLHTLSLLKWQPNVWSQCCSWAGLAEGFFCYLCLGYSHLVAQQWLLVWDGLTHISEGWCWPLAELYVPSQSFLTW